MFGTQTFNLEPDMICIAKALSSAYLPISGLLVNEKIYDVVRTNSDKIGIFGHGFTYSGHPVAAAVAIETLKIYEARDIVSHVRTVAPELQNGLRGLADHPYVGEVRGIGLLAAVEIVKNKKTRENFDPTLGIGAYLAGRAQEQGLLLRPIGDAVAFSPPLVITSGEISELVERFGRALDDTAAYIDEHGLAQAD